MPVRKVKSKVQKSLVMMDATQNYGNYHIPDAILHDKSVLQIHGIALSDSSSDSGKEELDEDYYRHQLPVADVTGKTVLIKASSYSSALKNSTTSVVPDSSKTVSASSQHFQNKSKASKENEMKKSNQLQKNILVENSNEKKVTIQLREKMTDSRKSVGDKMIQLQLQQNAADNSNEVITTTSEFEKLTFSGVSKIEGSPKAFEDLASLVKSKSPVPTEPAKRKKKKKKKRKQSEKNMNQKGYVDGVIDEKLNQNNLEDVAKIGKKKQNKELVVCKIEKVNLFHSNNGNSSANISKTGKGNKLPLSQIKPNSLGDDILISNLENQKVQFIQPIMKPPINSIGIVKTSSGIYQDNVSNANSSHEFAAVSNPLQTNIIEYNRHLKDKSSYRSDSTRNIVLSNKTLRNRQKRERHKLAKQLKRNNNYHIDEVGNKNDPHNSNKATKDYCEEKNDNETGITKIDIINEGNGTKRDNQQFKCLLSNSIGRTDSLPPFLPFVPSDIIFQSVLFSFIPHNIFSYPDVQDDTGEKSIFHLEDTE